MPLSNPKRRTTPDHAIVFVPATTTDPAEFAAAAAPCLERVQACGYVFAGIVRTWDDVLEMFDDGRAQVVVVTNMGQLPRDRQPRVETVDDPVPAAVRSEKCVVPPDVTSQRQRRPRRIS